MTSKTQRSLDSLPHRVSIGCYWRRHRPCWHDVWL